MCAAARSPGGLVPEGLDAVEADDSVPPADEDFGLPWDDPPDQDESAETSQARVPTW